MFIIHVHNLWRAQYAVIYWLLLNRDSINKCLMSKQIIFFHGGFSFSFSLFLGFSRFAIMPNNISLHLIVLLKSPIPSNLTVPIRQGRISDRLYQISRADLEFRKGTRRNVRKPYTPAAIDVLVLIARRCLRAVTEPHLVNIGMHRARCSHKRGHASSTLFGIRVWRASRWEISVPPWIKIARSIYINLSMHQNKNKYRCFFSNVKN